MYNHSTIAGLALFAVTVLAGAPAPGATPVAEATFKCKEGKSIEARFYADSVDLKLSDGRSMKLPQVMSGSGARYATADESFVFWNKGDTAFVTEGDDNMTYAECVAAE